jgi:UV excision repair protein RAD23
MGFPESESRAALLAANGNPDLAYEFLLTGIPAQTHSAVPSIPAPVQAGSTGIQQLRNHPQFNMLKQLIQSNPASLPQVLNLIGQQDPLLLQAIHSNERDFLLMMNEPISNVPAVPATASATGSHLPQAAPNAAQMIQTLAAMPEAQRAQFAASMGLSGEQLGMFMQMVSTLPPDQLEHMLAGEGREDPPGTIRLTHEEMEAVNRLMALGFSQQQAAQAYLACDKNETLAANFLFESGGFDDDFDDNDDMHS